MVPGRNSCIALGHTSLSGSNSRYTYNQLQLPIQITINCLEYECFQHGINYSGNDVGPWVHANDVWECQRLCREHDDCIVFVYNKAGKKCWMKHSFSSATFKYLVVAGTPDDCELL